MIIQNINDAQTAARRVATIMAEGKVHDIGGTQVQAKQFRVVGGIKIPLGEIFTIEQLGNFIYNNRHSINLRTKAAK